MEPISITNGATTLAMLMLLGVGVATDLHARRLPNAVVASMLVLGVCLNTIYLGWSGTLLALGGILTGTLILFPFYAVGGMGAGDVKFLAGVGSFLGPWGVLVAGILTLLLGGVIGVAVIVWQRIVPMLASRFFPVGSTASMSTREVTIPYSVAIAAGTIAALYYSKGY